MDRAHPPAPIPVMDYYMTENHVLHRAPSIFFKSQNHPNQTTSPGPNRRATCPLISHTKRKRRQTTSPPLNRPTIGSNRGWHVL